MSESRVTEDQFLGALLGMAIGDALGVPLRGHTADEISTRFGDVTGYLTPPDPESGSTSPIGQISDKTEIALCIVESLTTNDGLLDFDNIAARMAFVARSPSRATMSETTIQGIEQSASEGDTVESDLNDPEELAVATRGIPIGLMHALGAFDRDSLKRETALATRLSHRGSPAASLTLDVALHVCAAARQPDDLHGWLERNASKPDSPEITAIARTVADGDTFEEGVLKVVSAGGDADSRGAVAGGIAGARFGASGIPQQLIDDLDARIYLSLAAPWFYRTALRRQGTVIDLRTV
jgi:ADP-ribosyl-[dinitrogen reductase] hydrolase